MAVENPMQYSVLRTSLSIVLGCAITLKPVPVQARGIAERVVAADGDQVVEPQLFQIFKHLRSQVERC